MQSTSCLAVHRGSLPCRGHTEGTHLCAVASSALTLAWGAILGSELCYPCFFIYQAALAGLAGLHIVQMLMSVWLLLCCAQL